MISRTDPGAVILDGLAAGFGQVLRRHGIAASPAEVIDIRRVFAIVGTRDRDAFRAGLRACCVKYSYEQAAFDRAFVEFFEAAGRHDAGSERGVSRAVLSEAIPDALEVGSDGDVARYAEYNDRASEAGDYIDTPDADKGFNPHKDDDDISLTTSESQLSVDTDADSGRRGTTYTVNVDRAGSNVVGGLATSAAGVIAGELDWTDPESILGWLDLYDPHRTYGADFDAPLTSAQLHRLAEAVEAFVAALSSLPAASAPARERAGQDLDRTTTHTDVESACHEVLRRMRGAPRVRVRNHRDGRLDARSTARAGMRTDGVPFRLMTRTPQPDRVRLLILADVSLSVRPVTAFTLRLAQSLHRRAGRCRVVAFVDRPVDVTDVLLRCSGDNALAEVLANPRLDLEASSDYGRVFSELLASQEGIDKRTSVLVVGDGRCNGLAPRADKLAELRRRVYRLAWVTPEPQRYWAQATCSMPDYAEVCDGVVVANDPAQLIARARDLGNALR